MELDVGFYKNVIQITSFFLKRAFYDERYMRVYFVGNMRMIYSAMKKIL